MGALCLIFRQLRVNLKLLASEKESNRTNQDVGGKLTVFIFLLFLVIHQQHFKVNKSVNGGW